jgi:AraC family transcriptional activator of mtrCDE
MQQLPRISPPDLDNLMNGLEVNVVKLAECLVSPGWRLSFGASAVPAMHYNLSGSGQLLVQGEEPIALAPHMLVIVPANRWFQLDAPDHRGEVSRERAVEPRGSSSVAAETLLTYLAGNEHPQVAMICGYFRATYGASIDLFASLASPIVEHFDAADQLDQKLKSVLTEIAQQQIGVGAMTTALLKQVLVTLLRRSTSTLDLWAQRFSMLSDPQVARAFSEMVARPGAMHSVKSLAQVAGLSRSAFMLRFVEVVGDSPMAVLRQLRMRQAARLLTSNGSLSMDQIARNVGYASRGSFFRAFRKVYGVDPAEYAVGVKDVA